jgi:hypothetical protein
MRMVMVESVMVQLNAHTLLRYRPWPRSVNGWMRLTGDKSAM